MEVASFLDKRALGLNLSLQVVGAAAGSKTAHKQYKLKINYARFVIRSANNKPFGTIMQIIQKIRW